MRRLLRRGEHLYARAILQPNPALKDEATFERPFGGGGVEQNVVAQVHQPRLPPRPPDLGEGALLLDPPLVTDELLFEGRRADETRDERTEALIVIYVALLLVDVHRHLADPAESLPQRRLVRVLAISEPG